MRGPRGRGLDRRMRFFNSWGWRVEEGVGSAARVLLVVTSSDGMGAALMGTLVDGVTAVDEEPEVRGLQRLLLEGARAAMSTTGTFAERGSAARAAMERW